MFIIETRKFMYFGREYVVIEPSCLHELATFLKYNMLLSLKVGVISANPLADY